MQVQKGSFSYANVANCIVKTNTIRARIHTEKRGNNDAKT